jgi:hypothetical protein
MTLDIVPTSSTPLDFNGTLACQDPQNINWVSGSEFTIVYEISYDSSYPDLLAWTYASMTTTLNVFRIMPTII